MSSPLTDPTPIITDDYGHELTKFHTFLNTHPKNIIAVLVSLFLVATFIEASAGSAFGPELDR